MKSKKNIKMKPLTAAELAAHWATFEKVQQVCSVYGLARERILVLNKGKSPIYPGLELIYRLLTRYPELIPQPITPQQFMELVAKHGVTDTDDASRLLGKQRHAVLNYLATERPPMVVERLMATIQRFLAHYTIDELWAELETVTANPLPGQTLSVLEEDRNLFQIMDLTGLEEGRFYELRSQAELPLNVAFLVHLLIRFPDAQPPRMTVARFDALMKRHGIISSARISDLLGRVKQRWYRYRSGRAQPSGPTLALMTLIERFLETHPLDEYIALLNEVAAARGFDLTREHWRMESGAGRDE